MLQPSFPDSIKRSHSALNCTFTCAS